MCYSKFDNRSAIRAFSSHPQAMAVYGGDVGLDEFAKHSNARLLWETAQGRVTWASDMAVWSSHDGEDTLFNQFVQQARAGAAANLEHLLYLPVQQSINPLIQQSINPSSTSATPSTLDTQHSSINSQPSTINCPWNLFYRVTIVDALDLGLLDVINRVHGTTTTREEFLAGCQARAGLEEVFQQAYMCNPLGAATNHIVDWSAIERCRYDYEFIRVHFEHSQMIEQFGAFSPGGATNREQDIIDFIHKRFLKLFQKKSSYRLGFEVAASGQGDLA